MSLVFIGNSSSTKTIIWQPEPSTRGTWSILSVCIITTSLCVWTAVHLNIPPSDQKHAQFWRKLYWLGVGLFASEMVAYTAWYQRLSAAKGLRDIQKAVGQKPSVSWVEKILDWFHRGNSSEQHADEKPGGAELQTPSSPCQNEWTMAHAFYAYMGGFALDSSGTDKPILPAEKEKMRLTLKGVTVALKLRPGLLKDFPADAILDKSKASPLAKAIVCGQALWFTLQCLGRLIQSMPISLLELNTLAHCIFALVTYIQWWNKPLDIATPTILRGDSARELLAWMSMHMPMKSLGLSSDGRCEAQRIRLVDRDDPHFQSISTSRIITRDGIQAPRDVVLGCRKCSGKYIALADCDELLSTGLCFYDEGDAAGYYPSWFAILNPMDVERWKCAADLFKENPPSGFWEEYGGLLSTYTSDWPPLSQRRATLGMSIWVLFVCAGFLYGGLHALPWNSDFRTKYEKVLWRASVGMIIGFGPVAMAAYLAMVLFTQMKERRQLRELPELDDSKPWLDVPEDSLLSIFLNFLRAVLEFAFRLGVSIGHYAAGAICLGYGLARIFIVVECFIALFDSVPGVFEVPSWFSYFPHIT